MHTRMKEIQEFKAITFEKLDELFKEVKEAEVSNDTIDDLGKAWNILKDMAKCHHFAGYKDPQVSAYMGKMKDLTEHRPLPHTHQVIASVHPAPQEL